MLSSLAHTAPETPGFSASQTTAFRHRYRDKLGCPGVLSTSIVAFPSDYLDSQSQFRHVSSGPENRSLSIIHEPPPEPEALGSSCAGRGQPARRAGAGGINWIGVLVEGGSVKCKFRWWRALFAGCWSNRVEPLCWRRGTRKPRWATAPGAPLVGNRSLNVDA